MKMFGYVYLTTNFINGKMYIGQKRGSFDSRYLGSGKLVKRAIKKHGAINFSVRVLARGASRKALNTLEKRLIASYREKYGRHRLYNIADGGYRRSGGWASGWHHSEITRQKIAIKHKGMRHSDATRKKLSVICSGWKHTDAAKEKIRLAGLGRKPSEATRRKISLSLTGRTVTEDTRTKISVARKGIPAWNRGKKTPKDICDRIRATVLSLRLPSPMRGRKHTEEAKKKMSLAHIGKKASDETRTRMSAAHQRRLHGVADREQGA